MLPLHLSVPTVLLLVFVRFLQSLCSAVQIASFWPNVLTAALSEGRVKGTVKNFRAGTETSHGQQIWTHTLATTMELLQTHTHTHKRAGTLHIFNTETWVRVGATGGWVMSFKQEMRWDGL